MQPQQFSFPFLPECLFQHFSQQSGPAGELGSFEGEYFFDSVGYKLIF